MSLKTIHLEKPFCKLSLKVFLFIKDVSKPSQILEKTSLINILLEKFFWKNVTKKILLEKFFWKNWLTFRKVVKVYPMSLKANKNTLSETLPKTFSYPCIEKFCDGIENFLKSF